MRHEHNLQLTFTVQAALMPVALYPKLIYSPLENTNRHRFPTSV